jgi:hypothetical protein
MKYILISKDPETQEIVSQKDYRSLLQISKDLKTTYCSCYNNFLLHEQPDTIAPRKRSQLKFNLKYKIISQD